ncbi:glycosyltransferase [Polaribacter sp. 20A6]|uniref:glycosyltransferase n=1 Tax=Polaribacter sp. 20A6 TaxID=2687289 RepID=UPI0013FE041C|nr:glycosyltransferase [Polaribacter sp. 20A6]
MDKVCIVLNYAPHYRTSIFKEIDKELTCDFVFGDNVAGNIKKMDYSLLTNFKEEVQNKYFIKKPLYYQKGVLKLLKENYSSFLLSGELYNLTTWLLLLLAPFYGKKVYLWSHGFYGSEGWLKNTIKNFFFNRASIIFLYGNYAKSIMVNNKICENKLEVIYNSLNYKEQLLLRNENKTTDTYTKYFNNTHKNLVFVGRLTSVKRLDLLLKAMVKLREENFEINLTIIGDGIEKENIYKIIKDESLSDNIWMYGACYDEKILSDLIYNADLCVSPGNVGLTAIHSLMFGTPVITHDDFTFQMPEFEAVIKGETGDFFKHNNIYSLSKTIKNWILTKTDREKNREYCFKIVDEKYNPLSQIKILKKRIKDV